MLLGEAGFGIRFDNPELTQSLGLAALVMILAEGGLTTRWSAVKPALGIGIALSTVAVVVSVAVTGAALHWLLGLDWRFALLWGAVLASTDAAAVFSVLRSAGIGKRLTGALELESGINDAPAYIAVVVLAEGTTVDWTLPLLVVYELGAGLAIGLAFGWLGGIALRRAALPATGLYPLATVAVCVVAYSSGQLLHASGLLATYVAALVLGNSRLPHRSDTLSFAEGLGWLAQIGLFVLLGLFASPSRLLEAVVPGLVAGAVVLLLARPISVVLAMLPFRLPWREQAFLSWAGLRGAVPIVLAMIPLSQGVPGAQRLVDAVFVLVIVLTLLQGATLGPLGALARAGEEVRGARDRGRLRAAGRAGRRAAAGPHPARVEAARRVPVRAAAADRRDGQPGRARRRRLHPAEDQPAPGARPAAGGHHERGPRRRRTPAPRGGPGRAPGPLEGRVRPLARSWSWPGRDRSDHSCRPSRHA